MGWDENEDTFTVATTDATGTSSGNLTLNDADFRAAGVTCNSLNVSTTGTFTSTISAATGSTVGNLTLANGSITDSSGAISFGDENLSTTGTLGCGVLTAATGSSVGNLTLANGSITDSSGAISFGDENLSTTGTLGCGVLTAATGSGVGNLTLPTEALQIPVGQSVSAMKTYQLQEHLDVVF